MSKSLAMSRVLSPLAKQLRADRCFAILSAAHLSDKYLGVASGWVANRGRQFTKRLKGSGKPDKDPDLDVVNDTLPPFDLSTLNDVFARLDDWSSLDDMFAWLGDLGPSTPCSQRKT